MNEPVSYSFQRVYHLKAHTPLAHFQADQTYATLRASEVKPRLDHFLKQRAADRLHPDWFLRRGKGSLRYKMNIMRCSRTLYVDFTKDRNYAMYHSSLVNTTKTGLVGDVAVTVVCTIPALMSLIDEYIGEFFLVNNFGAMQSKGFGSFTLQDTEYTPQTIAECLKRAYGSEACYMFEGGRFPFKIIRTLNRLMKTGINYTAVRENGAYERSLMFQYMHEQGLGNEKAWLKEQGLVPAAGSHPYHHTPSTHKPRFVRVLMGLSDHLNYTGTVENRLRFMVRIKSLQQEIQRVRSPLFYKIVDGNIYLVGKPIDPVILGASFEFTSAKGNGVLQVPLAEELGEHFTDRFLAYCKDRLNGGVLDKFPETQGIVMQEVE